MRFVNRFLTACALLILLAGCEDGTAPDGAPVPDRLESLHEPVIHAVPGYRKRVGVRVVDAHGSGVRDILVTHETADGHGELSSTAAGGASAGDGSGDVAGAVLRTWSQSTGIAEAEWLLPDDEGSFELAARAESAAGQPIDGSPARIEAVVESFGPATDRTLRILPGLLDVARSRLRGLAERNPALAEWIEQHRALIEPRDIDSEIIRHRRFETTSTRVRDDREIPITTAFPAEVMRAGAHGVIGVVATAAPAVEEVFDFDFPTDAIRVWYGFELGARGGGGVLHLEDEVTYSERGGGVARYDAIILHEITHTYMGHEVLTQFVEVLLYNRLLQGAGGLDEWDYTRGYTGPDRDNTGIHALLDVFAMIGDDAMVRALRAVRPLSPRYGDELTAEQKQIFIDQAPTDLKEAVAQKMDAVGVS